MSVRSSRIQRSRPLASNPVLDAVLLIGALMFLSLIGAVFVADAATPVEIERDGSGADRPDAAWFDAARAGDAAALRRGIAAGVAIDALDPRGASALILAAYHGHIEAVDALLLAGADPDLADGARGNTALMGALFRGHEAVARRLLDDPRTDPDVRNGAGQTAAMFAALFNREAMIDALAARGADLAAADARGSTPEVLARQQGSEALADRIAGLIARAATAR